MEWKRRFFIVKRVCDSGNGGLWLKKESKKAEKGILDCKRSLSR